MCIEKSVIFENDYVAGENVLLNWFYTCYTYALAPSAQLSAPRHAHYLPRIRINRQGLESTR